VDFDATEEALQTLAGRIVTLEAKTLDGTTVMRASGTLASIESGLRGSLVALESGPDFRDCGAYVLRDEFRCADWQSEQMLAITLRDATVVVRVLLPEELQTYFDHLSTW
jgi:hypothetical protein